MGHTELVSDLTRRAKAASERVAELASDVKDAALRLAADRLEAARGAFVAGKFGVGDLVACLTPDGDEVARGLVSYDAREVERIEGQKTAKIAELLGYSNGDEVIHRDNLIVF